MSRKDKLKAKKYARRDLASTPSLSVSTTDAPRDAPSAHPVDTTAIADDDPVEGREPSSPQSSTTTSAAAAAAAAVAPTTATATAAAAPAITASTAIPSNLNLLPGRLVDDEMVFGPVPDREYHEGFMRKAIEMAEMALRSDETPVGCVFVHQGEIIGRGINGTNATLNGTRHAEFVALAEIMSTHPQGILRQTDLYVTVEPCIMCASALRQYGIRTVYFGCLNDRFGGTGGVMTVNRDPGVDPPYGVYGGLFREEAIMLLRRFYVQENEKAPEPKPKKNRELKTAILPASAPVTRTQTPTAIAKALAKAEG